MTNQNNFTQEDLDEFRFLVKKTESTNKMDRIDGRLEMPDFIKRVGNEKCEAMFEVLKQES